MGMQIDERVSDVLRDLVRHPVRRIVRRWNWKSAVLSAGFRSTIFFSTNLSAGLEAALAAMMTELAFRGITAGFYGALTQAFRHAQPTWLASVTVMLLLPLCTHTLELAVHWLRGTVRLVESILVSAAFTGLSTLFNLFAMRRGALIVGEGRGSLVDDLCRMPLLLVSFVLTAGRTGVAAARRLLVLDS
jgi:fatty acid desaturase